MHIGRVAIYIRKYLEPKVSWASYMRANVAYRFNDFVEG